MWYIDMDLPALLLEATCLIMAIISMAYFISKKRNFWALLIFGSVLSARLAGIMASLTGVAGFHIIEIGSVLYIQIIIFYFFSRILILNGETKTKPIKKIEAKT